MRPSPLDRPLRCRDPHRTRRTRPTEDAPALAEFRVDRWAEGALEWDELPGRGMLEASAEGAQWRLEFELELAGIKAAHTPRLDVQQEVQHARHIPAAHAQSRVRISRPEVY